MPVGLSSGVGSTFSRRLRRSRAVSIGRGSDVRGRSVGSPVAEPIGLKDEGRSWAELTMRALVDQQESLAVPSELAFDQNWLWYWDSRRR